MLPFVALWLVLAIAGVLNLGLKSRPRLVNLLNVPAVLIACGLWLWARPGAADAIPAGSFLTYTFAVPDGPWQLTGIALFVLLTLTIWSWLNGLGQEGEAPAQTGLARALWLGLGLLPLMWAGDPLTLLTTLTLFMAVWGIGLWIGSEPYPPDGPQRLPLIGLLALPILLTWFADAIVLSGSAGSPWVELSGTAVVLAGATLLGAWPLAGWRSLALRSKGLSSLALLLLPPIAGAAILLPVARQSSASGSQMAVAVLVGFLSLLFGLREYWRASMAKSSLSGGVAAALSGVVVLSAIFVGTEAVLSATRAAVFVPVLIGFLAYVPGETSRQPSSARGTLGGWAMAALSLVVWLVVLGMPLTVGFSSNALLYSTWLTDAQYLLVLILLLLLIVWSVTLVLPVVRAVRRSRSSSGAGGRILQLSDVVILIPLVALVQIDRASFSAVTVVGWLVLLIPFLVGPILAWVLDSRLAAADWPAASLVAPDMLSPALTWVRRSGTFVAEALADALDILEGPGGLMWVMVIVIAVILVS